MLPPTVLPSMTAPPGAVGAEVAEVAVGVGDVVVIMLEDLKLVCISWLFFARGQLMRSLVLVNMILIVSRLPRSRRWT